MMINKSLRVICSLFLVLFLCSPVFAQVERVKTVAEKKPVIYEKETGRFSILKTFKTRFADPPSAIGSMRKGADCLESGKIIWDKKMFGSLAKNFSAVYLRELNKARYPVPVQKDTIFEEAGEKDKSKAKDLQVGIFIRQVSADLCTDQGGTKGGVYMQILWQVFAPEIQKVVFEATTEGSYQTDAREKSLTVIFMNAFAVATRNFLAEPGFSQVISSPSFPDKSTKGQDAIKIKGPAPLPENAGMDFTMVRSAVVTITGDKGSGSGFFISQDGYLLTNHHVVGPSRFVKVKLATGRDLVGEVIRSDSSRDVALIKTEPISATTISIRKKDLNVGEEVYAVGSPLGHTFNTSITKGILSGYRDINGKKFLQSDVTIMPGSSGGPLLDSRGSAIGITVAGVVTKGFSGMNLFIPINEAISKLALEVD